MIDAVIRWFISHTGVTYSMDRRNGPDSYDCSSSEYHALIEAGFLPQGTWIGNTDSLFHDLENNGWVKLQPNNQGNFDTQRGDIFIWGIRGASTGGFGHTGTFIDAYQIIHCSYGYNGIHIDNYDWLHNINGNPEQTFYRYVGAQAPMPNPVDQNLEVGSFVKFPGIYNADDVQLIGGVWQVRSNTLCVQDFTWDENGVPAEPIVEVTNDSYATPDQTLNIGSLFKIPGKFEVLDLGESNGRWLVLLEWNGLKFWVDAEPLEEVASSDWGTSIPSSLPIATPEQPVETPVESAPETPEEPEPAVSTTNPIIEQTPQETHVAKEIKPIEKENPMAFSPEDQKTLLVHTEKMQEVADAVAASDEVTKLVSGVSSKVKLGVYIVGDALIGLGILTPNLALVFGWGDMIRIIALSSVFSAAGAFLLTMFGIYKSGGGK